LYWNDGSAHITTMTYSTSYWCYTANIGQFDEGTTVEYYIVAKDTGDLSTTSDTYSFTVLGSETEETNDPPTVTGITPSNQSIIYDTTPTIEAIYGDSDGIDTESVKLIIDDEIANPIVESYLFEYTPTTSMSYGEHNIRLEVSDTLGNTRIEEWSFTIVESESTNDNEIISGAKGNIEYTISYDPDFTPGTKENIKITLDNIGNEKEEVSANIVHPNGGTGFSFEDVEAGETKDKWINITTKDEVENFIGCLIIEDNYHPLFFNTTGGYNSRIYIYDSSDNSLPISDATVKIYKQVDNDWSLITEGTTDSEGYFYTDEYASPDLNYKIIVEKSGYGWENSSQRTYTGFSNCYEYYEKNLALESGYSETSQDGGESTPGFEIILLIIAICFIVIFRRKK
jgi:hypothetical protein